MLISIPREAVAVSHSFVVVLEMKLSSRDELESPMSWYYRSKIDSRGLL
jgi:hypothetical protein